MNRFKKFLKRMQPKAKYILGILGIAAIVSQGAFAFTKISATEPRFNFLSGDYEMFRGANLTAGDTVWKDPISGTASDTYQGLIYYHNGMVDTTAENTTIKVTIPSQTTNKAATLSASISADNAATVTDTIVDGQVVGLSGLTVNLDKDASLALVPGSVKWYPGNGTSAQDDAAMNSESALPNGQTGNSIDDAGINIGGIQGCWDFAGYVTFDFKATPITNVALSVDKTVRNVTAGETNFVELTNAAKSEVVEFKIDATNTGDATANNLKVKDALPADLTFVPGSMKIARDGSSTFDNVTDANAALVFAGGWTAGNLQAGAGKDDVITFEAKAPTSISAVKTVTNTATISSGAISDSDTAQVKLQVTAAPNLIKNKSAKNLTTGQVSAQSGEVEALDAKPGDTIEYTLITKNIGDAVSNNHVIKDGVNDVLQESNFISASNGGHVVDTGLTGNDSKQIQYDAVDIAPDQTVERTFTVKVMDPLPNNPASGYDFDHKLYNIYGDTVLVTISIPTPPPIAPILHISKTVRDFTINELNFVESNTATAGDTLEYMISFSNTGNGPADLVKFSDILPAGVAYIPGTTILSVNGGQEHTMPDGIVADGVMLDTVAAGDTGYIKLKAISATTIAANTVLTNTANLIDNNVTISDTASTTVKAPVVVASAPLPRTGADSLPIAAVASILLSAGSMLVIRRFV
ncbi:MAG: isopeptide-forming domain-containing fimbrial protein [Candidatus Berkelbacteria bacterium]